ncbi:MAG: hypothetical protein HQL64_03885 [Magnetococcales bacterium]|nr:hypothetical protein [Magnetococcales bacterium]
MQNDPISSDGALFANAIQYWREINPGWTYYGSVDPSMGLKGNSRNPSAILVGGFDRESGVLVVIEARIGKLTPDKIIETVIDLQARYCKLWQPSRPTAASFCRTA